MRLSTTNPVERHHAGRAVTAVASLAAAVLLLGGCGADDADDADELAPATNEPGAVNTAELESDEVVSQEP